MNFINDLLSRTNDFLSSYILFVFLTLAGIYFSFKTRFVQIGLFFDAVLSVKEKASGKKTSSFQALMISTASRVGVGNIAGVSTAIVAGGVGSIFWMWVMAILASSSAFIESTLAQLYKVRENGEFRGGPAYYIEKVIKKRWLGSSFAVLLILCFAYGFNALQAYNISSSLEHYIPNYNKTFMPLIVGGVLAILTSFIIFGGVHRIRLFISFFVPIMAIGYISLGIFIVISNLSKIPEMFYEIFSSAFNFKAIVGGFAGSTLLIGVKRGLLSNEAGMGSAANAAATADVTHPVKQGLVQVLSVFIDTLLICSTTAFIILLSKVHLTQSYDGIRLVQSAIQSEIGEIGIHFITIAIFFFAYSSIIGNYFYAESNILFLKDNKLVLNIFRVTCLLPIVLGTVAQSSTVWDIADILMTLMALVNIVSIFIIGDKAIICLEDYVKQRKQGKNPVFNANDVGIDDAEVWTN